MSGSHEHGDPADPLDRIVCVCFSVSLRKLVKFCKFEQPVVATQLSECYGAGTGCGWCRPFLERVFEEQRAGRTPEFDMSEEEYRTLRAAYRADKKKAAATDIRPDPSDPELGDREPDGNDDNRGGFA